MKDYIFDFDGTLADTMPMLTGLAVGLMVTYYGGSPQQALSKYLNTAGAPFREQLDRAYPREDRELNASVAGYFESIKRQLLPICSLRFDAAHACQRLAKDNRLHVVSSTKPALVEAFLDKQGVRRYFASVHGHKTGHSKEEQIKDVLQELEQSQPEFIGDTPSDYAIAQRLGINFMAVVGTFGADYWETTTAAFALTLAAL